MWLHSVLRRIVRNDAIRVGPPEVYNWRVMALAASDHFPNWTLVSSGVPDFKRNRELGLDERSPSVAADLSGNLVKTMQAGAVAGALLSSPFADRWGRKPGLLAIEVTDLMGGILKASSYGGLPAFYIGR
ncbi:hypothetical protein VUR80DRAFT_4241 [Thermomyces stellatus]